MSEMVKLTIIGVKRDGVPQTVDVTHDFGATLMSTLQEKQLISESFCGGRGVCGRCRVRFLQAAPMPVSMERRIFTAEELRQGYRLACMAKPRNSCVIQLELIESDKMDIVTDMMAVSAKDDLNSQLGAGEKIIAVDLGTTTIAMQLMDIKSGQVLDTYCAMNPQRSYGADVLSRIQAANAGHAAALKDSVWKVLQDGAAQFYHTLQQAVPVEWKAVAAQDSQEVRPFAPAQSSQPISRIACMCIAGNTTMGHLLMGLPTDTLGKSPFLPINIELQRCILPIEKDMLRIVEDVLPTEKDTLPIDNLSLPVYVLPGISAFVGGDIAAGLYCCHLLDTLSSGIEDLKNNPDDMDINNSGGNGNADGSDKDNSNSAILFIDLGTNGEMAITDGKRMIVTATAAGPAFEGGAGATVRGSDMVAVTASLLKQSIIDETGLLAEAYFAEGVTVEGKTGTVIDREEKDKEVKAVYPDAFFIHLMQQDVRALQMAKAAVRAGVDILCQKMGRPVIDKVYLAGGFGYYLDVDAAIAIGLLPQQLKNVVTAVGNTSLAGAFAMGKDFYTGRIQEKALSEALHAVECINLAEQDGFADLYVQYLNFPEIET